MRIPVGVNHVDFNGIGTFTVGNISIRSTMGIENKTDISVIPVYTDTNKKGSEFTIATIPGFIKESEIWAELNDAYRRPVISVAISDKCRITIEYNTKHNILDVCYKSLVRPKKTRKVLSFNEEDVCYINTDNKTYRYDETDGWICMGEDIPAKLVIKGE